jgi:hypothetical protein
MLKLLIFVSIKLLTLQTYILKYTTQNCLGVDRDKERVTNCLGVDRDKERVTNCLGVDRDKERVTKLQ